MGDDVMIDLGDAAISRGGVALRFRGRYGAPAMVPFRTATAMLVLGRFSVSELIDAVYGDDPDGGPLEACARIYDAASRVRRAFAALGIRAVGDGGRRRQITFERVIY